MPKINSDITGQTDDGQLRHKATKIHVECYKPLLGHKQGIYCVLETENGVFTAGGDGAIVFWSINELAQSAEPVGKLWASIPEPIFSLSMSEQEGFLLAGTQKGNLYKLQMGKSPLVYSLDKQAIYFIQQCGGNWWVGTGSGKLIVLNSQLAVLQSTQLTTQSLRCMSAQNHGVWIGASDANIYALSKETGAVISSWKANSPSVFALQSFDNNSLVSAGRDAHIKWFENGIEKMSIPAHLGSIHGLSVNEDKRWLASSSMDKSIKIWSYASSREVDSPKLELIKVIHRDKFSPPAGHSHSVNAVLWLKNALVDRITAIDPPNNPAQFIISVGDDRQALLWRVTEF